ncbi:MAG TPA: CheR family methyltransferase [Kofleriaceae bacterium]|nr:CheR family methyltransferase [Kofleriaceae bacterium]
MTAAPTYGDVERFRDLIVLRLGLAFEDARLGFLGEVLTRRLRARQRSRDSYLEHLEGGADRVELTALAQELTVPETYFFRHMDQFRAFAEVALPERMRARAAGRALRILSAGCASGEEPFTLAMIVRELRLEPGWDLSIRAIDMNPVALEKAAGGRFSTWSLRETPPDVQRRWFRGAGHDVLLDESIRAQVRFDQRNLAEEDGELWRPGQYDVVFCRNVIMYFAPDVARAVVGRISRAIAPGGYLFLGHAETLRGMSHEFHLCHSHNAFYYQRKDPDEDAASRERWVRAIPEPAPRLDDVEPSVPPADAWIEAIGLAADRIRLLATEPGSERGERGQRGERDQRGERGRRGDRTAGSAGARPPPAAMRAAACDLRPPLELMREERFGEALGLVRAFPPESAHDPDVRLLEAVLLAHSGQLAAAEGACVELLRIDELNAGAHYVLALCCAGAGDARRAIDHDQVAAYLDPEFAMPRLHLGLLARRAGDHAEARRELARALALLQREDASRLLFFGGGFNRDALLAVCRAELVASGGSP